MTIVEEALRLVTGDRQQDYGDIKESFTRIAGLWSAYLGFTINAEDVPKMMILLKVSRSKTSPSKKDNIIDIIGYSICYDTLINSEKECNVKSL